MKMVLCLPTLNAATSGHSFLTALEAQSLSDYVRFAIDSASDDNTITLLATAGFVVHSIPRKDFNHGTTRQLALELYPDADIIIFMTQDALLASSDALANLVAAFDDPQVGVSYGRQLPRESAGPIEAHARLFNYPAESYVKTSSDIPALGIKAAFISNSFAAYRRSALEAVGGFPSRCIVSEDTFVAARMLLSGWKISYCANAQVYHSHRYNFVQEFQRYFDIGVFHARQPWVRQNLGGAEGEGKKFVFSEIAFLLNENVLLVPSAILRTVIKYSGFRLGLNEAYFPRHLKACLSMQKNFWAQ